MNPLLNLGEFIPFNGLSYIDLEHAIVAKLDEAKNILLTIENMQNIKWSELQPSLYLSLYKFNQIWGTLGHLESVNDVKELREIKERLQPTVTDFYVNLGQNTKLFAHFKQIKEQEYTQLKPEEQRIVDNEFRDFFLSGITLDKDNQTTFKQIQNQLSQLTTKFGQNVLDATDQYNKFVSLEELIGVPIDVVDMLKQNAIAAGFPDSYKISLQMPSYLPIMQYCENRALRKELYTAYITRASELGDNNFNNASLICQILELRRKKAQLLGFNTYNELSLHTKMANSTEQVLDFLYQLANKSKNNALNDLAELQSFAYDHCNLDKLEIWDIAFVSEKLQQQKYSYSNNELKQYFCLSKVINGLYKLIYQLYETEFIPNNSIPTWHKDVQTFNLVKNGHILGHLYLDLYARNGKHSGAWMNSVQDRFKFNQIEKKPIAFIVCNFTPPNNTQESLLTFDEVQTLFHEMGHALHHLLTEIDHPSISGINGVEWDAVELPSQFMEYFTWNYSILTSISSHIKTKEVIPLELYNKLINSRYFQSGLQMLRQIEFAVTDMILHKETFASIEQIRHKITEIKQQIAVIYPPQIERALNSFTHIFAGGYAAGYYSYKWAEVLATDIFNEFDVQGESNYTVLGQKFYNTILSQGGSKPMLDNFIAFMGREPKIDALLKYSGIQVS